MKKEKIAILIGLLFFLSTNFSIAQDEFMQLVDQDSIKITYRWKSMPNTQHKGPLKLDLRIENKSDKSYEVSFVVDVFQNLIIFASSEQQTYCISPHKIMFGDRKYSSFDVSSLQPEDLNAESITIDLSALEIKEVEVCK